MHKRFILLLGVFLDSHVPTPGQMSAPQIVSAQERVAPIMTTVPAPVARPVLPAVRKPRKIRRPLPLPTLGAYERDQNLESLSPMREVKTLFLTQSAAEVFA
jgi:hypothetical protein